METARQAAATPPPQTRSVAGVEVAVLEESQALQRLCAALAPDFQNPPTCLKLAFCNAHVVNLAAGNAAFKASLTQMLVLPDGIGVDLGSRLLHGVPFPANLNGTDFMPRLLAASPVPLRVGLLGARDGVAGAAAAALAPADPRHEYVVIGHGYLSPGEEAGVLARLVAAPVDLLLVAFGNPAQEIWITRHIDARHAKVAAGVGALLDFWAGEVPRAPSAVRSMRLEWAWRLGIEPRRLWRRYVIGNPAFLWRVARQKLLGLPS